MHAINQSGRVTEFRPDDVLAVYFKQTLSISVDFSVYDCIH